MKLERVGMPEPPPWRRDEDYQPPVPGDIRVHGFVSKPELQKLNRNSIFVFVNGRLIRDRLVQHAIIEAIAIFCRPRFFRWCCCSSNCRMRKWMPMCIRRRPRSVSGSIRWCMILFATPCARR